ncbi:nucleoid occlusion protein [Crassaminicella thermophila]|uniref:Nucleoid occlusion protein n=1 Tax=Crassaminicella thermophila TaxID=2599308 RepID=A0A5C0SIL0_CRATE|nr:nucleoid occlusion protein [Crassaminicella thermophila]QEK13527.1 nucleoid occlusion protein [Crassaminicella thermophila]
MSKDQSTAVLQVPVDSILPNPYQPRKVFKKGNLEELSESIKLYGVLQPISVRKIGQDQYELVAGERRLRAAKLANLETIPAIVTKITDQDSAVLALIENLQREDLNFIEEAEGYLHLMEDHNFTQQEIAQKVGKNQSTIANKLRILKLPEKVKDLLIENHLTERHGRALLKLHDEKLQLMVLKEIIDKDLNVKKTEKRICEILDELTKPEEKTKKRMKSAFNFRIYLNTLKNAYNAIKEAGLNAEYKQLDRGEYIEVVVKIPKNK